MNEQGLERLRIAVVRQTIQDYTEALRLLRRHTGMGKSVYHRSYAEWTVSDCERFFQNDCEMFVDIDGILLMETIRKKSYDPNFRIRGEGKWQV